MNDGRGRRGVGARVAGGVLGLAVGLFCVGTAGGAATSSASAIGTSAAAPVLTYAGQYSSDPTKNSGSSSPLYGALLHMKRDGSFAPYLATSWHYIQPAKAKSGRTNKDFEFTLRKDAKFSDGTPVTAAAAVGWFQYYLTTSLAGLYAPLGPNPKFETVGEWTVRIHLTTPLPNFPFILSDQSPFGALTS